MFSLKTFIVSAALALSAAAVPARRAGGFPIVPGDNGSCAQYLQLCGAQMGENSTAVGADGMEFNVSRECAISATCYTMFYNGTVDEWIETMFGPEAVKSADAQRLPEAIYKEIAPSNATQSTGNATQQSFVDTYFQTLNQSSGPYPDTSYVVSVWDKLSAWTGFCDSKELPYSNFADWYSYSSGSEYQPRCA